MLIRKLFLLLLIGALISSCSQSESELVTVYLIYPKNNAIMDNACSDGTAGNWSDLIEWNFDWEDFSTAQKYHLYVRGSDAGSPLIDDENITSSEFSRIDEGSYIVNRNCCDWTWKVRAYANGEWTEWSEIRTFDVEPLNTDCP